MGGDGRREEVAPRRAVSRATEPAAATMGGEGGHHGTGQKASGTAMGAWEEGAEREGAAGIGR